MPILNRMCSLYRGLFLALFVLIQVSSTALSAQSPWANWQYHFRVKIDQQSSSENLGNYPISFFISGQALIEEGKLSPNGQDLRVCDAAGKPLCFWLENPIYEDKVKIWVKIPKIDARSLQEILVYYGNPQARPLEQKECVFSYFEGFESPELNREKWQVYGNGGYRLEGGLLYLDAQGEDLVLSSRSSFDSPVILEMNVVETRGNYAALGLHQAQSSSGIWQGYSLSRNGLKASMELVLIQSEPTPCQAYSVPYTQVNAIPSPSGEGIWSLTFISPNHVLALSPDGYLEESNALWEMEKLKINFGLLSCFDRKSSLVVDWIRLRTWTGQAPKISLEPESMSELARPAEKKRVRISKLLNMLTSKVHFFYIS